MIEGAILQSLAECCETAEGLLPGIAAVVVELIAVGLAIARAFAVATDSISPVLSVFRAPARDEGQR